MSSAAVFAVEQGALGSSEQPAGEVVLDGTEGHHAAQVRRVQVGEAVDVVDGSGVRTVCVVTAVERGRVVLRVEHWAQEPAAVPRVVVVQALAKGDRGERAVELLTEVGVDEIVPWQAARSVAQWSGERGERALGRWRATARESSKQSRRARFPEVGGVLSTAQVASRLRGADLAIVLAGDSPRSLPEFVLPRSGDVLIVVGPEGDLTDQELATFDSAGARRASLGPTVLRTSSAGAVATAVVLAGTRWQ